MVRLDALLYSLGAALNGWAMLGVYSTHGYKYILDAVQ